MRLQHRHVVADARSAAWRRTVWWCVCTGVAVVLCFLAGCDRTVRRERAAVIALVDSVSALPEVQRHAAEEVRAARRAIARADSLLDAKEREMAREAFAQANVLARLAVVVAEEKAAAALKDSSGATVVAKDSL